MARVDDSDGLTVVNGISVVDGVAPVGGFPVRSVAATATAAGTDLETALALTKSVTKVTTAASGTGVALPASTPIGGYCFIQNGGANDLEVYPHASDGVINAASPGGAITLAAATDVGLLAFRISAINWIAIVAAGPAT